MKKYLVDTQAFIWFLFDDPRMSDRDVEDVIDAVVDIVHTHRR